MEEIDTIHNTVGAGAVILYFLLYVVGLFSFLLPTLKNLPFLKIGIKVIHIAGGYGCVGLGFLAILTGIV